MAKSIRSKKKRKLRTLKREKLDGMEAKKIEERTVKLNAALQKQKEEREKKSSAPAPMDDAEKADDTNAAAMDFKEDDFNEFGKPPKTRRNKANQEAKRKKLTKKKGTKAFLNLATSATSKSRKQKSVSKKYFS